MRLQSVLFSFLAFAAAGGSAVLAARAVVTLVEDRSAIEVGQAFVDNQLNWAEVTTDGLNVVLTGEARDEAQRFEAISVAGSIVEASRVIDSISISQSEQTIIPRFSMELLKNDAGLSLIGLVPTSIDRDRLIQDITRVARGAEISDLLETADYPVPDGWDSAVEFGLAAMQNLPRSKVSIAADRVAIVAAAESLDAKQRLESVLAREAPEGVTLEMDITAPRPVISPYTLRFLIDDAGPRFDACAADTPIMRGQILNAARAAGLEGQVDCVLGLGVPSQQWGAAAQAGIEAVAELQGGSLTMSDTNVSLVGPDTATQGVFDRIAGDLEAKLPTLFSLTATLPVAAGSTGADGPVEFVAIRTPEGQVQLRGSVPSDLVRTASESLARAEFGASNVYNASRVDEALPEGWPIRVLAAIEALAEVNNGSVRVSADRVEVRGNTGDTRSRANISRILADKLGNQGTFQIDVLYKEALDPIASIPTAEECVTEITGILAQKKITFEPGSSNIDASARDTIDKIAELLKTCVDARVQIAGYTDSQGSEELNARISQDRADAVRTALVTRRITPARLEAVGFGEANPIADNGTEAGREANRRIEFTLISNDPPSDTDEAETDEQN
ncbi:OmpA family protein [Nereida sp. MMG025]|uniref:OmpA family protein n=1 Tax=Nereida sp. MMG025 TaxID=2909981 RepID=UPI001F3B5766|nr:OmpA family protein [Nereida sp. MMG025]MCF6444393.1 OmpA family protein [Nereida sp. MMG025]